MIKLQNVSKFYPMKGGGKHYVLDDVTIDLPSNENIGILGPNGAGKSTLLRMIGGAESPNSGKIYSEANISWPLGVGVGFQNSLSGRQNVTFVCDINGLSKSETQQVINGVLDFSELGKFFDMPVRTYSSGMRARLAFGLSINFEFDYYLIDELTAVGDAIFRKKAKVAFEDIKKKASLIFVAHNLKTLRESCDSALFLRNGKVTYYKDISEGIAVYEEYIEKHSTIKLKKRVKKKRSKKPAKKTSKKVAKKSTKKASANERPIRKQSDAETKKID